MKHHTTFMKPHATTQAIRGHYNRSAEQEHSEAIFLTSSFVFESAQQAKSRFAKEEAGNVYSRFTNPTVASFEQRLASLEGAQAGVATATGMAAIFAVIMSLLKAGDHIVASRHLFGTTLVLLADITTKFGITTTFVNLTDLDAWQNAMRSNTKLLLLETPSNPLNDVVDIKQVADIAHQHNALLAVDNCFLTPALQRPLEYEADIIIHSATKYIDGQGRCMGGAVLANEAIVTQVVTFLRSTGASLSPFNAWVLLKGLETLHIRMRAHCDNALKLAKWLKQQSSVERVYYLGLENHPHHQLAKQQQQGFGGIVSFVIKGGREAAWRLIDSTELISITANLGDVKTTITHPATTTHARLSDEDKQHAGIAEGLIRISVGLEAIEDIIADISRGL